VEKRIAKRLGRDVGVIGLGCWQLGADWGQVSEDDALKVLGAAADSGVTFLDTPTSTATAAARPWSGVS